MDSYIYTYMYIHTHTCMHTCIHTCIHTYMHACRKNFHVVEVPTIRIHGKTFVVVVCCTLKALNYLKIFTGKQLQLSSYVHSYEICKSFLPSRISHMQYVYTYKQALYACIHAYCTLCGCDQCTVFLFP